MARVRPNPDFEKRVEKYKARILEELAGQREWQISFSILNRMVEVDKRQDVPNDYKLCVASVALSRLVTEKRLERTYFNIEDTPHTRNGPRMPHYRLARAG